MNRRQFLQAVPAFAILANTPEENRKANTRRVYRHNGQAWREIPWSEMKPGDPIFMVGQYDDGSLEIHFWVVGPEGVGNLNGVDSVEISEETNFLA